MPFTSVRQLPGFVRRPRATLAVSPSALDDIRRKQQGWSFSGHGAVAATQPRVFPYAEANPLRPLPSDRVYSSSSSWRSEGYSASVPPALACANPAQAFEFAHAEATLVPPMHGSVVDGKPELQQPGSAVGVLDAQPNWTPLSGHKGLDLDTPQTMSPSQAALIIEGVVDSPRLQTNNQDARRHAKEWEQVIDHVTQPVHERSKAEGSGGVKGRLARAGFLDGFQNGTAEASTLNEREQARTGTNDTNLKEIPVEGEDWAPLTEANVEHVSNVALSAEMAKDGSRPEELENLVRIGSPGTDTVQSRPTRQASPLLVD